MKQVIDILRENREMFAYGSNEWKEYDKAIEVAEAFKRMGVISVYVASDGSGIEFRYFNKDKGYNSTTQLTCCITAKIAFLLLQGHRMSIIG